MIPYGPDPNYKYMASYYRTTFVAPGGPRTDVVVHLKADDGAVVYINGTEAVRDNMPAGTISSWTKAPLARVGADEEASREFIVPASLLVSGHNQVAVEVHQNYRTSSDVFFDLELIVR